MRAVAVPRTLRGAQRRLIERIVRWSDAAARALLALIEEPWEPDVADALAAACAHATFAPARPDPPDGVADAALDSPFADAQRALVAAAAQQEDIDANPNAAAYRRAEAWLRVAASRSRAAGSSPTSRRP